MRKWEMVELDVVADYVTKGTTPSTLGDSFEDDGIPFLRAQNINNDELILDKDLLFINHETDEKLKRSRILSNDVLITIAGTIGRTAVVPPMNSHLNCNQAVAIIRPSKNILPKYLRYVLTTQHILTQISEVKVTATISNLSLTQIKNLKIPLPPLPIQQQIAEVLDTADALRRCTQEQLEALDELAQGVFLEMFGDPALNPKGFSVEVLENFYINPKEGTKCGPFGSALKKNEYTKSGVAVWVMDNITTKGEFIENDSLWITSKKYEQLIGYSVKNGDIIISRAGTVGKMCVVKSSQEKSIISSNLIRLRFDESKLLPLYFVNLMTHFRDRVGRLKKGNEDTFTHMSTAVLDNLKFPYPPPELQTQFAAIIENIEAQKAVLREALAESEALFGGLLQRVFG